MKKIKQFLKGVKVNKSIQVLKVSINFYTIFSILEFVIALLFKVKTLSSFNLIIVMYKLLDNILKGFIF